MNHSMTPLITNDAIVLGILISILAVIFKTSKSIRPFWKKFYTAVPSLLLCYFIPSLFNSAGIISGDQSSLYFVVSRYFLPSSLVLLTISIDLKAILNLGPKAVGMFLVGTFGIIIGGPVSIVIISIFSPEIVGGSGDNAVWRGLTTVAGDWIGGGANQTAMKEVFQVNDFLFSAVTTIEIIVANIWLGFLLYGAANYEKIDKWLKADHSAIDEVRLKIESFQKKHARVADLSELTTICAIGFGATAIAHFGAGIISPWIFENAPALAKYNLTSDFFWIVIISTTIGLALSFTRARNLEGAGASRVGTLFLYMLVATIGMKMDVLAIFSNPGLILVCALWIVIHAGLLILVAKLIKAPFFFIAVGSQANIGGAASAPIVASAFHPALAPVGVLLAVLGYALGTYGAWLCGLAMQAVAP